MHFTRIVSLAASIVIPAALFAEQTESLKQFLDRVTLAPKGSDITTAGTLSAGELPDEAHCCRASTQAMADALHSLEPALARGGPGTRAGIAAILLGVAARPDGDQLLRPHLPAILNLLYDPDERVRSLIFMCLAWTRSWDIVKPALFHYIESASPNANAKAKIGAFGVLLIYAPPDPAIFAALDKFISGPLTVEDRAGIVHDLGLRGMEVQDEAAIRLVITSLSNSNPKLHHEAVVTMTRWAQRFGWAHLAAAAPALRAVESNAREDEWLRTQARKALATFHGAGR